MSCERDFPSRAMNAQLAQKARREYRKTGLFTLRRALIDLGSRAIDGRSSVGVALRRWKTDLVEDLGGQGSISTQQETLIELAARSKIMLDSIDNWILAQPTLINSRKKVVLAVVQQRQAIADGLTRVLKELGLKRVARELSLESMIEKAIKEQDANGQ
jgi:hypothetical protein